MNKKHLSVVMAGAMLASSVAPVLAAETTTEKKEFEVNGSNKGLLIRDLRNFINSKTFKNIDKNHQLAGKSVYYAKISGVVAHGGADKVGANFAELVKKVNNKLKSAGIKDSIESNDIWNGRQKNNVTINKADSTIKIVLSGTNANSSATFEIVSKGTTEYYADNIAALETAIQDANTGAKVEVWNEGYVEKDGEYYAYTLEETLVPAKFTVGGLEEEYNYFKNNNKTMFKAIYDMELNKDHTELTVYTRQADTEEESGRKVLKYKVGDSRVDFEKAINAKKELLNPDFTDKDGNAWITHNIDGFAIHKGHGAVVVPADSDIAAEKLYTITITDVANGYTAKLSDLYDGLFLTEKGQKLLDTMKEYDAKADKGYSVDKKIDVNTEANGLYSIKLTFVKTVANGKKVKNEVKVTTNDKDQMDLFAKGISEDHKLHNGQTIRKFPVQQLIGANRYETAVKVAKENADIRTVAENGNIVLVNSNSLVDGLAAAPLAASVWNKGNTITNKEEGYTAPILLTDANGIPKATKDYMKEVVAHQRVGALDKVTVYLVGGEAVISPAVKADLEEIGLRVVRAGGADREETSLRVAELINRDTLNDVNKAFLVGADGEADAMSIAAYAAQERTPIIVESRKGISDKTLNYLKGYKADSEKDVTIIGGEAVLSKETETKVAEAKLKVERVAGSNRQATNAAVIDTFYPAHSISHVLVSKDGKDKKAELIDALTATSIAAKYNSPIVLGTKSLTKGENGQINALEKASRRNGVYVYQIGGGVHRDVIKTIAERIGLAK